MKLVAGSAELGGSSMFLSSERLAEYATVMPRLSRRALASGVGALSVLHALRARAANDAIGTFPLSLAFASVDGQRVQDSAWQQAELAEAERLYAPLGVHFRVVSERTITTPRAHLETRADRDALAVDCAPKAINVFVVASLRDVDDGVSVRRGVHWRSSQHPSQRYVILSAIAGPSVLAHELGHYFGNGHSAVTDNVMSYERTGAEVFLDARQAATIRSAARLVLTSGEVTLAPSAAHD